MRDALTVTSDTIKKYGLITAGDKILCACSGGPDSVFLLLALKMMQRKKGFTAGCIHINHNLRGKDSDKDALFVKELAASLNLPFYVSEIKKRKNFPGTGLEAFCRKERYRLIEKTAIKHGYNKIATGHTADDQAETFILWLARGKSETRFSGIYPSRFCGRTLLIRPLIGTAKKEIMHYLERKKVAFRVDKSNCDLSLKRNFIRRRILPLLEEINPAITQSINGVVEMLKNYAGPIIENKNINKYNKTLYYAKAGTGYFKIKGINAGIKILVRNSSPPPALSKENGNSGIKLSGEEDTVYFDAGPVDMNALVIRFPGTGDRIVPFGHKGSRKLKDIFAEKRIPSDMRRLVPLVEHKGKIIWLCGLKRSAFSQVTDKTRKVLVMRYIRE